LRRYSYPAGVSGRIGLAAVHLSRNALGIPAVEAPLRRSDAPRLAAIIGAGGILGPVFIVDPQS
jgi:hypothetical protein